MTAPFPILFEDNHLLVVDKPAGIAMEPGGKEPTNLLDTFKNFIKARDQKPGRVFLGLVHRLDKPVAGVVVFAKTSKAASRLAEQFRTHTIQKTYHTMVEMRGKNIPKGSWQEFTQYISKEDGAARVRVSDKKIVGAKEARMAYRLVRINDGTGLMEVRPHTGRPHQIRAGLASLGLPIIGDRLYGSRKASPGGIALLAKTISFDHPTAKKRLTIESWQKLSE